MGHMICLNNFFSYDEVTTAIKLDGGGGKAYLIALLFKNSFVAFLKIIEII